MSSKTVLQNGKIYVPAKELGQMLGADVSKYVVDINGVDMVYADNVKNFDKNVYATYNNALVVFSPKAIVTGTPRYPDAIVLADVMLTLGGFEVLPTCLDTHMGSMEYGIGIVGVSDKGVCVDILRTVDAPAAKLYVVLYDGDRLDSIVSTDVSAARSEKFSFDIADADKASEVKAFIVSGDNVLNPLAKTKNIE